MIKERGRIGQQRFSGIFLEEFVPELTGQRGIKAYREMSENDDVIGAILFTTEMLIRQCEFSVTPGGNKTEADRRAAKFVESCMNDMSASWQDTLSEILSFLTYGWSYHEIVYKRRTGGRTSKYDDMLIGWAKLPIRAQETLERWEYKDHSDDLLGMVQRAAPDYEEIFIPLEKAIHFRTKSRKDNPEGRSILRNAYRDWYFKKRMQEIEGIGVERDLAGYPMLKAPEGMEALWDDSDEDMRNVLATAENIITRIRRDEMEGIVIPPGWEFALLSSGSRRQFEVGTIIERYDKRMTTTVLADFILLGQQSVGSFALSSDKTRLFALAVGTYLDVICDAFNTQAIPRLIDLNEGAFKGMTDYPKMEHGDVEDANLDKFSQFIGTMVANGVIVPDEELEKFVRKLGNLPMPDETTTDFEVRTRQQQPAEQRGASRVPGLNRSRSDFGDEEAQARRKEEQKEHDAEAEDVAKAAEMVEVRKYNPYHGKDGRFTTAPGGKKRKGGKGKKKSRSPRTERVEGFNFRRLMLPEKEYGKVCHAVSTHYDLHRGKPISHHDLATNEGYFRYGIENHGFDDFIIFSKEEI